MKNCRILIEFHFDTPTCAGDYLFMNQARGTGIIGLTDQNNVK